MLSAFIRGAQAEISISENRRGGLVLRDFIQKPQEIASAILGG